MPVSMQGIEAELLRSPDRMIEIGASIQVHAGSDTKFAPKTRREPGSQARNVWVLMDAGTCMACADMQLAERIVLSPTNTTTVADTGGIHDKMPNFLARIHIRNPGETLYGAIMGVQLAHCKSPQVLPGRQILLHYHMRFDGSAGKVKGARQVATSPVISQNLE